MAPTGYVVGDKSLTGAFICVYVFDLSVNLYSFIFDRRTFVYYIIYLGSTGGSRMFSWGRHSCGKRSWIDAQNALCASTVGI